MTLGASNVSFGMPGRHAINAAFLPMAMHAGLTSAIMDARTPQVVESVKAADLLLGHDEWGGAWIAALPRPAGRDRPAEGPEADAERRGRRGTVRRSAPVTQLGREGLLVPPAARTAATAVGHDGTGRVRLQFTPAEREFRVPPGVSVFDAASWNGIAIDSTCGGHGTCKKCKVRISTAPCRSRGSTCARSLPTSSERLAAGLPGAGDRRTSRSRYPRW